MKISVCTDMVFRDLPTHEAMGYVKAAGADAVEFWETNGKDLAAIAQASRDLDLPVAAFCAPSVPAMIAPEGPKDYPEALRRLSAACDMLNCRVLIATSGAPAWNWTPSRMHDCLRATLDNTLPVLEEHDLILLLEPLNASELSYLQSSREAFDLCRMLNSPRLKVLYDIYHMQSMEGNLINTLIANLPLIGHIHIADLPGRTAPGRGEINFPNIARALRDNGYTGYLGLEYLPAAVREKELAGIIAMLREE